MRFYWLTLEVLAVWRITHFLYAEDGPLDVGVRLRKFAKSGVWGRFLDCFHCLSFWTAAPVALWMGGGAKETVYLWLALSAGAILVERLVASGMRVSEAPYFEHGEAKDELLREQTGGLAR